jgi:hypothetical protein
MPAATAGRRTAQKAVFDKKAKMWLRLAEVILWRQLLFSNNLTAPILIQI